MQQQYKDYLITASAIPSSLYNSSWCWYAQGSILKSRPNGSVVEVVRIKDNGITFDLSGLAVWYGMELCRLAVDECLNQE